MVSELGGGCFRMYYRDDLEVLCNSQKVITENIVWRNNNNNPNVQIFEVQVLSDESDFFIFYGRYHLFIREILSIALVYQKNIPLTRIDKKEHKNPKALGGDVFTSWHKHIWDLIWEDKHAIDVTHEFQDGMKPGEFVFRFMEENNMELGEGFKYQKIMDDF